MKMSLSCNFKISKNLVNCLFLKFFTEYVQTMADPGEAKAWEANLQLGGSTVPLPS